MWNFGDIVETVAGAAADEPCAFIHGAREIAWRDAKRHMDGLAWGLWALGVRPGDKVAFYMRNGPEYGELAGACFLAGFVHVNINYRYSADEVFYILDNSDAVAVVYAAEFAGVVASLRHRLPEGTVMVEIEAEGQAPASTNSYDVLARTATAPGAYAPLRSPDNEILVYTGGTTGLPKGVIYRQGDLAPFLFASSGVFGAALPQTLSDLASTIRTRSGAPVRYLVACPQMHGTGLFVTMWTMFTGGVLVTAESSSLDADEIWRTVERRGVTNMAIVGDAFARPLLRALEGAPRAYQLDNLVGIGSSGAMWSEEVKRGLLEHLPQVVLTDVFASTETTGIGVSTSAGAEAGETAKFLPGAAAIVIDEFDQPIPPGSGVPGRLAVGGMQPLGYYKDPEKTAKTFRIIAGVRYSIPGDYAIQEADGRLTLLGRGSHCINTAGEKVYPEEVEEAIKSHPDVDDALVIGTPDERFGQAVTAVVSMAPGARFEEHRLRSHVRARLAGYKTPRRLFASASVFRAPNGKADYRAATAFIQACLADPERAISPGFSPPGAKVE